MTSPGCLIRSAGTGDGWLSFGEFEVAGLEGSGEEETTTSAGSLGVRLAGGGLNSRGAVVVDGEGGGGGGGGAPHCRSTR